MTDSAEYDAGWCDDCCPECGWHARHTAWCPRRDRSVIPPASPRPGFDFRGRPIPPEGGHDA